VRFGGLISIPHDTAAHIIFVVFDIQIPHSASLKDKRRVLKSLKDRVRARFNASIAEIDHQDEWQRSIIGITMISNDRQHLERGFAALNRLVEEVGDIQLLSIGCEWL
jgi:uncharacterized protein YlxP (DUF503 family)